MRTQNLAQETIQEDQQESNDVSCAESLRTESQLTSKHGDREQDSHKKKSDNNILSIITKPVGKKREAPKAKLTNDALPSYQDSRLNVQPGTVANPTFGKKKTTIEKIVIENLSESDDGKSHSLGSVSDTHQSEDKLDVGDQNERAMSARGRRQSSKRSSTFPSK